MRWFILCVGICSGWMLKEIYTDIQELTCNDFSTKHSIWQGFSASKNGQVRCFWLEQAYPNRIKQGVIE